MILRQRLGMALGAGRRCTTPLVVAAPWLPHGAGSKASRGFRQAIRCSRSFRDQGASTGNSLSLNLGTAPQNGALAPALLFADKQTLRVSKAPASDSPTTSQGVCAPLWGHSQRQGIIRRIAARTLRFASHRGAIRKLSGGRTKTAAPRSLLYTSSKQASSVGRPHHPFWNSSLASSFLPRRCVSSAAPIAIHAELTGPRILLY